MLPPLAEATEVAVAVGTVAGAAMQMPAQARAVCPVLAASRIDIKLLRFGQFEHAQAQKQDSTAKAKRNRRSFARSMQQIGPTCNGHNCQASWTGTATATATVAVAVAVAL